MTVPPAMREEDPPITQGRPLRPLRHGNRAAANAVHLASPTRYTHARTLTECPTAASRPLARNQTEPTGLSAGRRTCGARVDCQRAARGPIRLICTLQRNGHPTATIPCPIALCG